MPDDPDRREDSGGGWGMTVAVVLLLLALYVLSVGPACWLAERFDVLDGLQAAYLPLFWVADVTGTWDVLLWYVYLWVPFHR